MTKSEQPPFQMIIHNGRLEPATQYDQERLDTWRNGTLVNVVIVQEGARKPIAKWFATLTRAVKETKTPWSNVPLAHKAVKASLGIIDVGKDKDGHWYSKEVSLKTLTDPEIEDAYVQLLDLLFGITGVDQQTWRDGVSHIDQWQDQTQESSEGSAASPLPDDAAASGFTHPSSPDAANQSAGDASSAGAGAGEANEREMVGSTSTTAGGAVSSPAAAPAAAEPPAPPTEPPAPPATKPAAAAPKKPDAATKKAATITRADLLKMLIDKISDREVAPQDKLEQLDEFRPLWLDNLPDDQALVKQAFDTTARTIKGVLTPTKGKNALSEMLK